MKKIIITLITLFLITSCAFPQENTPTPASTNVTNTEISPSTTSEADNLTVVASTDCSIISDETMDTVSLYTSASKENGRFHWDDQAYWLLEISSDNGNFYKLYDADISNGSINFDIVVIDNVSYILVKNISTASNYTKTYKIENSAVYETNELDLNNMQDKSINLIYTSIPNYR